ncbi:MAG: FtsX-like permease family protein [Planctomycetes bacterium]|nr:FtsX-like permease family protein [Planctomycetota bacterium]
MNLHLLFQNLLITQLEEWHATTWFGAGLLIVLYLTGRLIFGLLGQRGMEFIQRRERIVTPMAAIVWFLLVLLSGCVFVCFTLWRKESEGIRGIDMMLWFIAALCLWFFFAGDVVLFRGKRNYVLLLASLAVFFANRITLYDEAMNVGGNASENVGVQLEGGWAIGLTLFFVCVFAAAFLIDCFVREKRETRIEDQGRGKSILRGTDLEQLLFGWLYAVDIVLRFLYLIVISPAVFITHLSYFFIAGRYLSKRLISILAMAVIAGGVMVLILVTNVMTGFQGEFRTRVRGTLSHIVVDVKTGDLSVERYASEARAIFRKQAEEEIRKEAAETGRRWFPEEIDERADIYFQNRGEEVMERLRWSEIDEQLARLKDIALSAPSVDGKLAGISSRLEGYALYSRNAESYEPVQVVGIEADTYFGVSELAKYLEDGFAEYFRFSYQHYINQYWDILRQYLFSPMITRMYEKGDAGQASTRAKLEEIFRTYRTALSKGTDLDEIPEIFENFKKDILSAKSLFEGAIRGNFDAAAQVVVGSGKFTLFDGRVLEWKDFIRDKDMYGSGNEEFDVLPDPALYRMNRPWFLSIEQILDSWADHKKLYEDRLDELRKTLRAEVREEFGPDAKVTMAQVARVPFIRDAQKRYDPEIPPAIVGLEFYRSTRDLRPDGTYKRAESQNVSLITGRPKTDESGRAGVQSINGTFEMVAVFKTGLYEADRRVLYLELEDARNFVRAVGETYQVGINVLDINQTKTVNDDIKEAIRIHQQQSAVPNSDKFFLGHYVSTWEEQRQNLMQAVDIERSLLVIIISVLLVFAGMAIAIIILLIVYQKTRDIGILTALGATRKAIVSVFLYNGFIIGVVGTSIGVTIGVILSAKLVAINNAMDLMFGVNLFPPEIYYLTELPIVLDWASIGEFCLFSTGVCYLWSIIPAFVASLKDPVEALHYE